MAKQLGPRGKLECFFEEDQVFTEQAKYLLEAYEIALKERNYCACRLADGYMEYKEKALWYSAVVNTIETLLAAQVSDYENGAELLDIHDEWKHRTDRK